MDSELFLNIVKSTPLVSIDLVIRSERERVLLGWRVNRPAQNCWFVPGGRIRKNERIASAYDRIGRAELGIPLPPGRLLGVYDHFYTDNFENAPGIDTHYVVIAFECHLAESARLHPDAQHSQLRWWRVEEVLANPQVHENTKKYFQT